jgi:hypothetical protein
MKKFLFFVCCIAFIIACSRRKVPNGILPPPEMQEVLWDLMRTGDFLESYVFSKDSLIDKGDKGAEWYENVFRLHHTTREAFEKSYQYYRERPELMKEVLDSLGKKRFREPVALPADSIKGPDTNAGKKALLSPDSIKKKRLALPPGHKLNVQ